MMASTNGLFNATICTIWNTTDLLGPGELLERNHRRFLQETIEAEAFFEDFEEDADNSENRVYDIWRDHDDSAPEHGCVTLFDFSGGEKAHIIQIDSSAELRRYFSAGGTCNSSSHSSQETMQPSFPMRRLFVLEGLDPIFTDILGSRLKIPPSVFIAQASGPGSIDITDADGSLHDPSQYWNVQVQQLHKLAEGFYTHAGSSWKENVTPKKRAGTFVKRPFSWSFTTHLVSFWSTKYDEESWDGKHTCRKSLATCY